MFVVKEGKKCDVLFEDSPTRTGHVCYLYLNLETRETCNIAVNPFRHIFLQGNNI
jgi:hypothetical protein